MIDGITSQPFSAITLPPIAVRTGSEQKVIAQSRERYAGNRKNIEEHVSRWSGFGDDVDIDVEMKKVKDDKKAAKKEKYAHDYECTRCKKTFKLPVELDRNRPIYCEECHPIVMEERKKGKGGNKVTVGEAVGESQNQEKKIIAVVPKINDGELVIRETDGELSLDQLMGAEKDAPVSVVAGQKQENNSNLPRALDILLNENSSIIIPDFKKPKPTETAGQVTIDPANPTKKKRRRRKKKTSAPDIVKVTVLEDATVPVTPTAKNTPAASLAPGERVIFD